MVHMKSMVAFLAAFLFHLLQETLAHNPHDSIKGLTASTDGVTVFTVSRRFVYRSTDSGLSWDQMDRGIDGTRTEEDMGGAQTLAMSPSYDADTTLFYATDTGVFRTVDAGLTWSRLSLPIVPFGVQGSIAVSRSFHSDRTLLVSGRVPNVAWKDGAAIYRSVDAGMTFVPVWPKPGTNTPESQYGITMLFTREVVFAGTDTGTLLWSVDSGATWKEEGFGAHIRSLAEVPRPLKNPRYSDEQQEMINQGWVMKTILLAGNIGSFYVFYGFRNKEVVFFNWRDTFRRVGNEEDTVVIGSTPFGVFTMPFDQGRIWRSQDEGASWDWRGAAFGMIRDRHDLGGWQDQAASLHNPVFTQLAHGGPFIFVGTFCGLHRSADGGDTWVKLDTLSRRFTSMALAPSKSAPGAVVFAGCTYMDGCYKVDIDMQKAKFSNSVRVGYSDHWTVPTHMDFGQTAYSRYCVVTFSPNYKNDGIMMRFCSTLGLLRSGDGGNTWEQVVLRKVRGGGSGDALPFTVAFSPKFGEDNTVFIGGNGIGIAKSDDQGKTFHTLWDADGGLATKIYISPAFDTNGTDQTMVVLAGTLEEVSSDHVQPDRFDAADGVTLFITENAGQTWKKQGEVNLESIVFSPNFGKDHLMAGLAITRDTTGLDRRHGTLMTSSDFGQSWSVLSGLPADGSKYAEGVGRGGLALAPDFAISKHIVAAYFAGGVAHGKLDVVGHNLHHRAFISAPWDSKPWKFAQDTDRFSKSRPTGDMIAYSPHYQEDGALLAVSYYSLYASFDHGYSWKEVFRLGHYNHKCDVQSCTACHYDDDAECIACSAGFHPNGAGNRCVAASLLMTGANISHAQVASLTPDGPNFQKMSQRGKFLHRSR